MNSNCITGLEMTMSIDPEKTTENEIYDDEREVIISFKNVYKDYTNYKSNHQRMGGVLLGRKVGDEVNALKDVSFDIHKGEKVALIGTITAGKTSIMRLIAGIIRPTKGTVFVNGECSLIFDHKYGFKADMTGRQNIRSRAELLGWSSEKERQVEEEIIAFSGLEEIIDDPVKTYPTGSMARVGLGIETAFKSDIMLYDEYCNFGGRAYLPTCIDRMKSAIDDDTTVIMTVGNYPFAKQFCTRGIVIDKGELVYDGKIEDAVMYFRQNCKLDPAASKAAKARMREEMDMEDDLEEDSYGSDFG